MTQTTFTVTDADVGTTIGLPDGFITDLTMTTPPPVYEVPSFDEGKQIWTAGYFVLRGLNDYRDIVCISPQTNGGAFNWTSRPGSMLVNRSIAYAGSLVVVAVPKGSVWSLTLSDAPIVRSPPRQRRPATDPPLPSAESPRAQARV